MWDLFLQFWLLLFLKLLLIYTRSSNSLFLFLFIGVQNFCFGNLGAFYNLCYLQIFIFSDFLAFSFFWIGLLLILFKTDSFISLVIKRSLILLILISKFDLSYFQLISIFKGILYSSNFLLGFIFKIIRLISYSPWSLVSSSRITFYSYSSSPSSFTLS